MNSENPYLDKKGIPKLGMFKKAFEWARTKELERQAKLPEDERKRVRESERALAKRMNT